MYIKTTLEWVNRQKNAQTIVLMFDSSFFRLVYSHTNPHSRSWLALWQTETWKQASCLRVTHKHGSSEQERKKKNKNKKTRISRMLLWQHWNAVRIMCDSFLRPWTFLYLAIHLLKAAIFSIPQMIFVSKNEEEKKIHSNIETAWNQF